MNQWMDSTNDGMETCFLISHLDTILTTSFQLLTPVQPSSNSLRCTINLSHAYSHGRFIILCIIIIIIIFRAYIPPIPDGNMSKYWRCSAWSSERYILKHIYDTH
eukprot:sb/3477902/